LAHDLTSEYRVEAIYQGTRGRWWRCFASLREACAAGFDAERADVTLYDSQLGSSLPEDARRVLQNNRDASLNNHLPAFQRRR